MSKQRISPVSALLIANIGDYFT